MADRSSRSQSPAKKRKRGDVDTTESNELDNFAVNLQAQQIVQR
jgi:hypothetical protein